MSIKSEVSQFFSSAISKVVYKVEGLTHLVSCVTSSVTSTLGGLITGDVVGINVTKIPEMQDSIRSSVKAIQDHLDSVHTDTDPSIAFADPDMQTACRSYIEGVMTACKAYTSNLLRFVDLLSEVKGYYETNQAKQAETVTNAGQEAASSVEAYTEGTNANS